MFLSKKLTSIFAPVLLIVSSVSNAALPTPPEEISQPYPDVKVQTISSAEALINQFKQEQYQLNAIVKNDSLPAIFVENLPMDLNSLPVEQKTSGFIRLLLPTIIEVNKHITEVRNEVISLSKQPTTKWTQEENAWMKNLMTSYDVKSNNVDELLLRLDVIPIGMVLAQGIDESGWGTSYFAVNGNSLYGEHLSSKGGKYLSTPGGHVKVAAFDNLFAGTARYMYNLNTTSAYKDLWTLRQKLRQENKLSGSELVQALSHYSTRGQAYVDNLRALIKHHQLDSFNTTEFNKTTPLRIRFTH